MKRVINLDEWNRKEHFQFFGSMDDPFFGLTTQVDFTEVYREAKADRASFFLYSLHKIIKAVNETEDFRLRVEDGQVVCFDVIHAGTTIGREDGTFGFGFFDYYPDREQFVQAAQLVIRRVQAAKGLCRDADAMRQDLIRFSPVPWVAFTEMKHATSFHTGDTATRISTGKLVEADERMMLPVSITAHHGLVDGRHVGLLLDKITK